MKRRQVNKEYKRSLVFKKLASAHEDYYWDIFIQHHDILKDFDIIFVDDKSTDYGKHIKNFFKLKEGMISSCFYKDNLRIINEKVLSNNLREKNTKIFTSFDVQLDTNVISELDNLIRGKNYPKNHQKDLQSLTKRREVHSSISFGPYIIENYYNNNESLSETTLDVYYNILLKLNRSHSNSFIEAVKETKMQTYQFKKYYENEYRNNPEYYLMDGLYKRIYLNLLKMIILNKVESSIGGKVYEMLKFQNEDLCSYLLGEMNIAVQFFEQKFTFTFFNKLQNPKKDKVIDIIKNMAWDIFHLRNLEVTMSLMQYEKTDFVLPMLYSFDKKFNELRKSSGLRMLINDKKSLNFYPFYKEDKFNKYIDIGKALEMTNKKEKKRRIKEAHDIDLDKLIRRYEKEVIEVYYD